MAITGTKQALTTPKAPPTNDGGPHRGERSHMVVVISFFFF